MCILAPKTGVGPLSWAKAASCIFFIFRILFPQLVKEDMMIIQTGNRTDIPAFYSDWFAARLREGFVMVRNALNPIAVTRYRLDPELVDLIVFCSKNPETMLAHMDLLAPYHQYWFVTITPYGKDIEPNVPDKNQVMDTFCRISEIVGPKNMCWRYDPILIDETWTCERHIEAFSRMCQKLAGYTQTAVISFIDLYQKVRRNFPEVRAVPWDVQLSLTKSLVEIASKYGMTVKPCGEDPRLSEAGADCSGCMTRQVFENAIGRHQHSNHRFMAAFK